MLKLDLIIPRYHVVSDREPAHVEGLGIFRNLKQFKDDMEYFLANYTPVTLQEVISFLDGSSPLPNRCFIPTFDDGFREAYDVIAPILLSKGIPAVFFVNPAVLDNRGLLCEQKKCLLIRALNSAKDCTGAREVSAILGKGEMRYSDLQRCIRKIGYQQSPVMDKLGAILGCDFEAYAASLKPYLTTQQAKGLLERGFSIGAHSEDHPLYSELTLEEQIAQTRNSLDHLSQRMEFSCRSFAFPYNDEGVSEAYFQAAFDGGLLQVSFGSDGVHRHFYPRNLERFKMEYPEHKAPEILARELWLAIYRKPWWTLSDLWRNTHA
jgi:peptidoglycan/xylan/chitin deacetylase (PgdA/CDA1 family)